MKKLLSALLLLIIILIVGGLGLRHFAQRRMESAIADLRTAIGPNASFTYATATPRMLALGARFTSVSYRDPAVTVTASDAVVGRVTGTALGGQRFGHILLHDVQVMQPGVTATIALLELDGLVLPNGGPARPDGSEAPPRLDSVLLDKGGMRGLHVAAPASQLDLTIDRAAIAQFGLGRMSHLDLNALSLQINLAPRRHVAIGHLRVDGPDFAGQIASLVQSGHMVHAVGHRHFDVSGLAVDAAAPLLRIGHLLIDHEATANQDEVETTVTDLSAWPMPPRDQSVLHMIGYDHFAGMIHALTTVERQGGQMSLHPLVIDAPGMGRVTILADLDQIPVDDPMSLMDTARIVSATIDWQDRSLAAHVLDGLARSRGMEPDAYRQQVIGNLGASPDPSMQALGRFLAAPDRRLRIALRPPRPLNLLMLGVALSMAGDPATAGMLGLSASTP